MMVREPIKRDGGLRLLSTGAGAACAVVLCLVAVGCSSNQSTESTQSAGTASLTAAPNPVPGGTGYGTTTVAWNTGDGSWGQVYLFVEGQPERLFAQGATGSQAAPWISAGAVYEFRLYAGKEHKEILASVAVTRSSEAPTSSSGPPRDRTSLIVFAILRYAALGAVVLLGYVVTRRLTVRWRMSRPIAATQPATDVVRRSLQLVAVNSLVFVALFVLAETGYRIYVDGFPEAFSRLRVPYSNLGTSNWVVYDPEIGYRLNPARDEINSRSVRHGEIRVPKPAGLFRILVLGDSIPAARNGFVDTLRASLEASGDIEVINASVPGYTSYQEVQFFERHLRDTEPDLVVWTYCLNDNHRFLHRFDENAGMLWTDEARQSLQITSGLDSVVARSYILTSIRLGITNWLPTHDEPRTKFHWESTVDFSIAWKDHSWSDYERDLQELRDSLTPDVRLAIVVFPYEPQLLHTDEPDREYVIKPQLKLRVLCRKYAVPCLDFYPLFAARHAQGERLYEDGVHLNTLGHDVTAREILKFLAANKLIPTPSWGSRAQPAGTSHDVS